ncbi:hypothetical protein PoB_002607500 [Plakobranchus ocellatus]|uniref:Uncharacterized protein n=1 Tax=Plakobranchus ocellatus TaxID=259542 RepID=A0AAV3ZWL0_9GAST|nr:hypothetical protein PoB_002607500 [Plakobranchus ocellatus]
MHTYTCNVKISCRLPAAPRLLPPPCHHKHSCRLPPATTQQHHGFCHLPATTTTPVASPPQPNSTTVYTEMHSAV